LQNRRKLPLTALASARAALGLARQLEPPPPMLRRLYDWALSFADKPYAVWVMAAISFADSSFLPLVPDVLLVPMVLGKPRKAMYYATVCTLASVAGAVLGYMIGALLWDTLGQWLIKIYGGQQKAETFRQLYAEWGAWVIVVKGFTPIPYKLVTIVSGFAGYNFAAFIGLSLLTRGARFFALAFVLQRYGSPVREVLDRHLSAIASVFLAVVVVGVVASIYLF
jgi:membrane protein YqaA with SNARE-associated domain